MIDMKDMTDAATKETLSKTRGSALKFYETFWELHHGREEPELNGDDDDDDDDDDESDSDDEIEEKSSKQQQQQQQQQQEKRDDQQQHENEAIKTISGSSSLDADGGSCGPGDDAFCWTNLLWLSAACFIAHQMEIFDVAILSPLRGEARLNTTYYILGIILLMINFSVFYYLVIHLSWNRGVKSGDWDTYVPHAVPAATASFVGATLFISIGLWPIYGVLTVPILSTVFMGFIVFISMVSQIYKWRRFGGSRTECGKKTE